MLWKEKLYESQTKRIRLSIWKDSRRNLVMHLQELDVDPTEPSWESFKLLHSWSTTVATAKCARATAAAVKRFYEAYIDQARTIVAQRVATLEGGD